MNEYLKEIADLCGIQKELTYHTARHTFATTVTLNNNVPIESVSKMLGHKSLKQTQHYAKILNKKVSEDMQVLTSKLNGTIGTLVAV
jgi:site-specific recombinase XerD